MKKILNQFDAQGIRSGMATPSCCSCCCCSCVGTLSVVSSEMIIRSDDVCVHGELSTESEQKTFPIVSFVKKISLFTVPVLLLVVPSLLFHSSIEDYIFVAVGVSIIVYYLGVIIYFAKKSKMTLKQYLFLALRVMILFSVEFGAVFFCLVGGRETFFIGAVFLVGVSLFEYWLSLKRGANKKNAIKQTVVIMSMAVLLYIIIGVALDVSLYSN